MDAITAYSAYTEETLEEEKGGIKGGIRRFDATALYTALDTQRQERGMSWQQVARELGVSASTLTRTRLGGRMEVDGMLAMVRWLGRTAESFVRVVPPRIKTRV